MKPTSLTLATLALTLATALPLAAAGPERPVHFQKGSGMTEPVVVHKVAPDYPEAARDAKTQGTVVVDTLIAEDGTVSQVKLLEGADPDLDGAALAAAAKWRFRPVHDADGKPVSVYYTLTFRFALD